MFQRIATLLWWLALSVWLGGMVGLGLFAAPAIFKTVRTTGSTLPGTPPWLDAKDQLGGEIFGNILERFMLAEWYFLGFLAIALIILLVIRRNAWMYFRLALVLMLAGLLYYNSRMLTPEVMQARTLTRTVQSAEADARFKVLHKRAEMIGQFKVWILVALVGLSAAASVPAAKPAPAPSPKDGDSHA